YYILLKNNASSFYEYVKNAVFSDENSFSLACEKGVIEGIEAVKELAKRDLAVIGSMALVKCEDIKHRMKEKFIENLEAVEAVLSLPDWNPMRGSEESFERCFDGIVSWYGKNGAGVFSQHSFFTWDGHKKKLVPVKNPDPITLDRLYLVDSQKETAVKNTEIFLDGMEANNILFYGDRGTGKSSMVKAIANKYYDRGLRLIEVPKEYLDQIPVITSQLSDRGLKFILFIDDLAFENNEEKYTALKAVLEGGIEHKPSNILLYATSNRRHLVKENFSDRIGLSSDNPDDEIRARDSMQEKLSLADRFGITIIFSSPLKNEYLTIVNKMAEEENLEIEPELLTKKAMQWEMMYNGMSPRTARQFINWIKTEMKYGINS
ncbi:MAG TPA: ATP-binding protein, partial [Clostridia bacterium]